MTQGIIIVNKPMDWTSFDVCAKLRYLTKEQKVGHSGTLDPMATGVLPVFIGKATKSIQYFMEGDKGYEAEMVLGERTDTGDARGKKQTTNDKNQTNNKIQIPNDEVIIETVKKYIGEIEQVPPMFSAKKINGQKLYELARKGIEIKREPKKIKIYDLKITNILNISETEKRVSFSVTCSKGTYIRQLAMDIGDELGCGAYLSKLVRTYAHPFRLSQAINMETIITLAQHGKLQDVIIRVEDVLDGQNKPA